MERASDYHSEGKSQKEGLYPLMASEDANNTLLAQELDSRLQFLKEKPLPQPKTLLVGLGSLLSEAPTNRSIGKKILEAFKTNPETHLHHSSTLLKSAASLLRQGDTLVLTHVLQAQQPSIITQDSTKTVDELAPSEAMVNSVKLEKEIVEKLGNFGNKSVKVLYQVVALGATSKSSDNYLADGLLTGAVREEASVILVGDWTQGSNAHKTTFTGVSPNSVSHLVLHSPMPILTCKLPKDSGQLSHIYFYTKTGELGLPDSVKTALSALKINQLDAQSSKKGPLG